MIQISSLLKGLIRWLGLHISVQGLVHVTRHFADQIFENVFFEIDISECITRCSFLRWLRISRFFCRKIKFWCENQGFLLSKKPYFEFPNQEILFKGLRRPYHPMQYFSLYKMGYLVFLYVAKSIAKGRLHPFIKVPTYCSVHSLICRYINLVHALIDCLYRKD